MMIVSNTIVRSRHFDLRTQIHCNRPDLAKRGWHGPDLVNTSFTRHLAECQIPAL